ncbi:membrane-anchored ubiquitin-fold protein 1 isoform X2 [Dendrobium catenatum]|uniref:Membrane-anchored ubiquitin-fold protein n=1 Tax=Dendrobium catenatum TaxID=906689 RepID=A0A2I0VY02_9ASPA|nr:membrane-anchored ubiquitin-fold protein 1 isoform X2 [Dendrobium catenatum]PKU68295.1 Membrane-anchored ubiquitin-fold protein 1 [Dendrobium catenatum]
MSGVQEQLEIRFRLPDGSDIGPKNYSTASTVTTLKESIIAEWPKEMENQPRTVNDLKLINAGRILENNNTLAECRSPICDLSGVTTMHVVVRPPSIQREIKRKEAKKSKENQCGCVIL